MTLSINFIRLPASTAVRVDSSIPGRGNRRCIAKKSVGTMARDELSRSPELSARKVGEIQMDDRKWWTEADKGSGQVERVGRMAAGRGGCWS